MRTLALLLFAASAYGQVVYEIRGTVVDTNGSPVANAAVSIGGIDKVNRDVTADAGGTFRATVDGPGLYFASARKDGYFATSPIGSPIGAPMSLDSAHPQANTTITLARAAEIVGRLVDDETREPIPNAKVYLIVRSWSRGNMMLTRGPTPSVSTDAEGNFRFPGLPPSVDYLVSPHGLPSAAETLIPTFTAEDVDRTDDSYATTFWPGGSPDAMTAAPIGTSSGYANIGNVYARKIRQYRARVTLGACDGSARVTWMDLPTRSAVPLGVFPCGSQILLKGFDRGGHTLYASPDPGAGRGIPAALVWGSAVFAVIDKTAEVRLPLLPGSIVEGRIVIPEEVRKPTVAPGIGIRPRDLSVATPTPLEAFVQWNEDQLGFRLAVSPLASQLEVVPFGGEHYVGEIRWNGAPLPGGYISAGSPARGLEIVFDNKFASLNVTVTDGSRTVPNAMVFAIGYPTTIQIPANAGADGHAAVPRLAPGDYRLIAIPQGQQASLDPPGVFQRLLSTAPRVTLSPGGTQSIEVHVSDPR